MSSDKKITVEDIGDALKRMNNLGYSVDMLIADEFATVVVDVKKVKKPFIFR